MTAFELSLLTSGALSLLLVLATYGAALVRTRRHTAVSGGEPNGDSAPQRISILKPLCGVDEGLWQNLAALAEQESEDFEIILGCEDPRDPALDVARRLQRSYPERTISVIAGAACGGANPKVRLLRRLQDHARYPWLLISDSNVRPTPSYLRRLRETQRESDADLVHCLLAGAEGRTFGERLEDLQLCGSVAPAVCFTDAFGHPCVIGKSMLLRRSALEEVGGLEGVMDVLAEDYVLGNRFWLAGKTVSLCPYILPVINRGRGLTGFFNRHVRWGQMRRHIAPGYFTAELAAQPLLFLGPLLFLPGEARWFALAGLGLKWGAEAVQTARLSGGASFAGALFLPLKDLFVLAMWPISFFKRTVSWRGSRMLVTKGSLLVPASPSPALVSGAEPAEVAY